jgi:hypothetical protein
MMLASYRSHRRKSRTNLSRDPSSARQALTISQFSIGRKTSEDLNLQITCD